jgi:hypothetical protein
MKILKQTLFQKTVWVIAFTVIFGTAVVLAMISFVRAQAGSEIIHACVAQAGSGNQSQNVQGQANTGSVRIVSGEADCKTGEYYMQWNNGSTFQLQIDNLQNQVNGILEQLSSLQPTSYKDIAAGDVNTCIIRDDNTAICFGVNYYGASSFPAEQEFLSLSPSPTYIYANCGIKNDGRINCWGYTLGGFLSPEGTVYKQVVAGNQLCGLTEIGNVKCWDAFTLEEVSTPADGQTFIQVEYGGATFCGLKENGSLFCWGSDASQAMAVPGETTLKTLSMSAPGQYCGLTTDGTGLCWGNNMQGRTVPSTTEYKSLLVSGSNDLFLCGLKTDGYVECWGGENWYGELDSPTDVTFSKISLGASTACGITTDGGVRCWGDNSLGQAPRQLP